MILQNGQTDGRHASDAEQAWQFGETTGNKRKINKAHYNQARALNLISSILRIYVYPEVDNFSFNKSPRYIRIRKFPRIPCTRTVMIHVYGLCQNRMMQRTS